MARQDVNVKFILILSLALVVIGGGVAWLGYTQLTTSAEEHIAKGDKLMAEGNYKTAEKEYSKAVSDDRTRVDWLHKWKDSILNLTPEKSVDYQDKYQTYFSALKMIATLRDQDVVAQREYLQTLYHRLRTLGSSTSGWQSFANTAEERYSRLPQGTPEVEALRRYQGLALIHVIRELPETETVRRETLEHLQAASAATDQLRAMNSWPSEWPDSWKNDIESETNIIRWHLIEWVRSQRERRADTAATHIRNAREAQTALQTKHPNNPNVLLSGLDLLLKSNMLIETTIEGQQNAVARLAGQEQPLIDSFQSVDPSTITPGMILELHRYLAIIHNDNPNQVTLDIVENALTSNPVNAQLLRLKGVYLASLQRHNDAIDTYQQILDAPDLPISLDGIILNSMQPEALYQQSASWIELSKLATDPIEKTETLENAKAKRSQLADAVRDGEDASPVLLLDADIATLENRHQAALAHLTELERITPDASRLKPEVLMRLGRVLEQQNKIGAALEQYNRILQLQPTNIQAIVLAATIDVRLHERERALTRLYAANEAAPGIKKIEQMILSLEAFDDSTLATNITDPVLAALVRVQELRDKIPTQDLEGALALVNETIVEHPADIRLWRAKVQLQGELGDAEALKVTVPEALALFPGDTFIEKYERKLEILTSDNPLDAIIAMIEETDAPEAVKKVRVYMALRQSNQEERALTYLKEAEALDPDRPEVIDALFLEALINKDLDAADTLATRASRLDIDHADGLVYKARVELARSQFQQAMRTLEQATEKLPYNAELWRMLGEVQLNQGVADKAVTSLQRAYDQQPQDLETARIFIRALMQLERLPDALAAARQVRTIHRRDFALTELWLTLEEAVGDKIDAARVRAERYENNPENKANTYALIRLLITAEKWEEARSLLTDAKDHFGDDLDFIDLQARWYAKQGGDGIALGREHLQGFIDRTPEGERNEVPYLVMAQFLLDFNRVDEGIEALDQAVEKQSPETMIADRVRGERMFTMRRYNDALQSYKNILDADADNSEQFSLMRYIECLVRLDNWDEADAALRDINPSAGDTDLRAILLGAQVAEGRGELPRALDLLNQAVTKYPNDVRTFLMRAQINFSNKDMQHDVVADTEQVLRLQPTNEIAYQMRHALFIRSNQPEEAVSTLAQGISANPSARKLRELLVRQFASLNRMDEAQNVAEDAIKQWPGDTYWLKLAGDVYLLSASKLEAQSELADISGGVRSPAARLLNRAVSKYTRAAELFARSFEIDPAVDAAYRLAKASLGKRPPDAQAALDALDRVSDEARSHTRSLIILARAQKYLGNDDQARADAESALDLVSDVGDMAEWLNQVKRMHPRLEDQVVFMNSITPPDGYLDMYRIEVCRLTAPQPDKHQELIAELESIKAQPADKAPTGTVAADLNRVLGMLYYANQKYAEAASCYDDGILILPNDLEFNNNLAFTRAKHLGDPQGALEPARHAVDLAPSNAIALDTLGWIMMELNQHAQAQQILQKAIDAARTPQEKVPTALHMAQSYVALGQGFNAAPLADRVREMLETSPRLRQEYGEDFDALMEALK